ncbi:hypothetical protein ACFPM7_28080 [Actinokineospora guangxiensis]|uniref:Uncharacterized protein n=1 Tax=Actinokineospora guangxiensis TaxID=1490288 RepID=A0ABW0EXM8_9PSEU
MKRIPLAVGIVIALVIGVLFVHPATSLQMQYPFYWLTCGKKPVIASDYTKAYVKPGEYDYGVSFLDSGLYCTEEDAQREGYKPTR